MTPEFSAAQVTTHVLEHLERQRQALVAAPDRVGAEVDAALEPIALAYREQELPPQYLTALASEIRKAVPAAWLHIAAPQCAREGRDWGLWRGGDPIARLTYVLIGLVLGGLIIWVPFIPIWEKWFPFLLAALGWWLPDVQKRYFKRQYARALGRIVGTLQRAQPQLEASVPLDRLLSAAPDEGEGEPK